MKLLKLTTLKLKTYIKNPIFILTFIGAFLSIWGLFSLLIPAPDSLSVPIAIIDLDNTDYSNIIINRLNKKESISIKSLSSQEAIKAVSVGNIEAVYILKEGLMDKIVDGDIHNIIEVITSPVNLSSKLIGEFFAAEVIRLSSNVDAANSVVTYYGANHGNNDILWVEAWENTDKYWQPTPLITTDYSVINNNKLSKSQSQINKVKKEIIELLILTLLTFSMLIGTSTLFIEKRNGILNRVITTQTSLWIYITSVLLSLIFLHTLLILLIISNINQLLLYFSHILLAGSLGIMIVSFSQKINQLFILIPLTILIKTFLNSLLILKYPLYNDSGIDILYIIILSFFILIPSIKYFQIKEMGDSNGF